MAAGQHHDDNQIYGRSATRNPRPRRVAMLARLAITTLAMLGSALVALAGASAAGPVEIFNGGDHHESIGQGDTKPLSRGVAYTTSTFPLAVRVRPPDTLWEGVQFHSGKFRFVQLQHMKTGNVPLHGRGYVTLESSTGKTGSVAATIQKLHATKLLDAGQVSAVRVAGFSGKSFDATVIGTESGDTGIALTPFTAPRHCGWCTKTMHGETLDNKFAGKGQLFRIIVIGVRGKTVVIYLESTYDVSSNSGHTPEETFPTFLPYAQKLLATLTFPR